MKVIVLMENTAARADMCAEHGLSLYVETNGRRVLFDAGQTEGFARNARTLGVDLSAVDTAILSHGHYDHGGGLMHFLSVNRHAPVYVNEHAFSDCWHGEDHPIGLDPALARTGRIVTTQEECRIGDGLALYTMNARERRHPLSGSGLTIRLPDGTFVQDGFAHEQYLLVEEGGKRILFSGCSHKGILNIMEWLRPDVLIGGFHLMKIDPAENHEKLRCIADRLSAYPTMYFTCHCTGLGAYEALRERMGGRLAYLAAGDVLLL